MKKLIIINTWGKMTDTMFIQASSLIKGYFDAGLMVHQTPEDLKEIAQRGDLVLALLNNQVIACGGITQHYPDNSKEFGAWAVESQYQNSHIGKTILMHSIQKYTQSFVFSVANEVSAKIFQHLGATLMSEDDMHEAVFIPCATCNCPGKENTERKCVDTFHDLRTIQL